MAVTPQNNDAFFREVDDEVRRDRIVGFWTRYGKLVAALVVAALLALAGYLYWEHRQTTQAGADGEVLTQSLADVAAGKGAAARPTLTQLSANGREGYRAAAKMVLAAEAGERGDVKAAVAQYGAVHADTGLPEPFRNLALIRQTTLQFDTLPPTQVVTRMAGIAVPGNPFFGSAGELVGAAHAKAGDRAKAGQVFAAMAKDEGVPQSIRARAARLAGVYGVTAIVAPATGN